MKTHLSTKRGILCGGDARNLLRADDASAVTCRHCLNALIRREVEATQDEDEAWLLNRQYDAAHAAGFGDAYDWLRAEGNPSSQMTAQIIASVSTYLVESGYLATHATSEAA